MLSKISLYRCKDQCLGRKILTSFPISFHQVKLQSTLNNHGNMTAAQLAILPTYVDSLKRRNELIKWRTQSNYFQEVM